MLWADKMQCSTALSLSPSPLLSFSHTGNVRVQLAQCLIGLRHVSWHPQLVACNLRAVAKAQVGHGEGGGGREWFDGAANIFIVGLQLGCKATYWPTKAPLATAGGCLPLVWTWLATCHVCPAVLQQIPETVPAALPVWTRSNFGKIIQMQRAAKCKFAQPSIMLMKQPILTRLASNGTGIGIGMGMGMRRS